MTYYVMVTQPRDPAHVICELSGSLQATSFSEAEIEVGNYREQLNKGQKQITDRFAIVVAYREDQVEGHKDFERFRNNEVTVPYERSKKHGQVGLGNDSGSSTDTVGGVPSRI